jgi:ubiquinone/menaquinone biosynthesis C-methylase UbiE
MAGDERKATAQDAAVLLVIGPAQAACLDAEQSVVVAELGHREVMLDQVPGRVQHQPSDTHPHSLAGRGEACSRDQARMGQDAAMPAPGAPRPWRDVVDATYGDDVEKFYEQGIDSVLDESLTPRGPGIMLDMAEQLGLASAWHALDVGSRDGRHLAELQSRFRCRVTGVEPAPANLARMRRVFGEVSPAVVRGVAESLPFPDQSFDFIWVRDVLGHVPSLPAAFNECRRVLRTGAPVLVFHVFATPLLEPAEAERLWRSTAVVPSSADRLTFEQAVDGAGLRVERREELHGEWREHGEEHGDHRTSRQLLRVARMLREPDRYRAMIGERAFEVEFGNCLYGIYQLLGKLSAAIYVLR